MKTLSVDHLLGIKYLKEDDLHLIFETAYHFKEVINRPIKKYLAYAMLLLPISFLKIPPERNCRLNLLKSD